jgi:hypothetical protein
MLNKYFFTLLIVCTFTINGAYAKEFQGKIVKSVGEVKIKNHEGELRSPEEVDYIAHANEEINTMNGSRAVVSFTNGSVTVLGSNSTLGVEKPTLFSHIKGKIFFAFAQIAGPERMVRSNSAVFGIRATTFIVDGDEQGNSVALKEGLLNVEAPDKPFEFHLEKELSELDAFKTEMMQGTKKLRQEGDDYIKKEKESFIEYKKQFLMEAGNSISFDGNKASKKELTAQMINEFSEFELFAQEALTEIGKAPGQEPTNQPE